MCSGSEPSSYLRLIDSCITQLKAQGPSRICNESKQEEEEAFSRVVKLMVKFPEQRSARVNPKPSSNPKPYTLNPKPYTLNSKP